MGKKIEVDTDAVHATGASFDRHSENLLTRVGNDEPGRAFQSSITKLLKQQPELLAAVTIAARATGKQWNMFGEVATDVEHHNTCLADQQGGGGSVSDVDQVNAGGTPGTGGTTGGRGGHGFGPGRRSGWW
jgi:hypothetical protein